MTATKPRKQCLSEPTERLLDTGAILRWFKENGRDFPWRRNRAPRYRYRQIVSEILLRRTSATKVAEIYYEFFREHFPTWESLAAAAESELKDLGCLHKLGLKGDRAQTLSSLSKHVVENNYRLPDDRSVLEEIHGVGLYAASAILLFRHGQPAPFLDSNMARVLIRFYGLDKPQDLRREPELFNLATRLVSSVDTPLELNWALLDLGSIVCKPRPAKPACNNCPLIQNCRFAKTHLSLPRVL